MEKELLKQVKILKVYSAVLTLVVLAGLFFGFTYVAGNAKFKEIDVERINIVEKTGKLRMVISNSERQHPGIIDGKTLPKRQREPGMIFFNTDGDECGGLVYDGTRKEAGFAISIDKYRNDQIMQLQYNDNTENGKSIRSYGLKFWDRPENFSAGQLLTKFDSLKKLNNEAALKAGVADWQKQGLVGQDRMFVGKNSDNEVGLFIKDKNGKPRIYLYVDNNNKVVFKAMDEQGRPIDLK
ncbi:hypothetical protein D0C36_02835 [Mucilaginibacter conchicola]|uniref:Uncharacterized protein n=1 Tax=Mucilaginibacter conchicola TaxID=2303333 RepID=A0A372NXV3_9SPHI|nr:hypothetical protein [Mucilaginibacter conchicola]RFZ94499.1 hypothetical protein D0C36_02835 [Mucilaginibacter conchicola]